MTDRLPVNRGAGLTATPDWVLTGYRQDGLFVVAGSNRLAEADISSEVRTSVDRRAAYETGMLIHGPARGRYTFRATTVWTDSSLPEGEVMVMAWSEEGYAEALRRLFEFWTPGGDPLGIGDGG